MNYAVVTFGCRVNQADSFALERRLRAAGGRAVPAEAAELIIVNSCTVTATADHGTRQAVRRISRINPAARIVATGCYATRDAEQVAALPGVVAVVPNDDKERLVDRLLDAARPTTAERFGEGDGGCGLMIPPGSTGRTTYTLRVQTGCDETCAYCIIPSTRGPGRSVSPLRVLAEVEAAVAAGYQELALTGVHLGSYGRDLVPPTSLLALLEALDRHPSQVSIRLSSLEPMDCTPAIVDLVTTSPRLAPHFHLPLQHASDSVLRAMRRPYTRDDYRRVVTRIRARLPHAAIGSDLVVGFPGETEADVETMLYFLDASPLTSLHVFPYSDRPGTRASRMPGKVHGARVRERARAVRAVGATLASRFRADQVGSVRPGLTLSDAHGALVLTDNYLKVRIPPGPAPNTRVQVRVESAGEALTGKVVREMRRGLPSTATAAPPSADPVIDGHPRR